MEDRHGDKCQGKRTAYLIGIGMGGEGQLTLEAKRWIRRAQAVAGARRPLESVWELVEGKAVLTSYQGEEIVRWLSGFPEADTAAVVFSGDVGFYSGAAKVKGSLEEAGWEVRFIPGISSLAYLASRAGIPWQEAKVISLHGREENWLEMIRVNPVCFLLLGGRTTPLSVCRELREAGMGDRRVVIGADLSYPQERILEGTAKFLLDEGKDRIEELSGLCCALVLGDSRRADPMSGIRAFSLRDQDFIRGKVPMTKEEIRTLCLAKLALKPWAAVYDIGAGTGSVSIAAKLALQGMGGGSVWAIERNPEAVGLIQANRQKFLPGDPDFYVVEGTAPECLEGLPAPDRAFIGGSGGNLQEMIESLLRKNPQVRIVISAITLETLAAAVEASEKWDFEEVQIIQAGIAQAEKIGRYHMQKAQNPIYLITLENPRRREHI